MDSQRDSPVVFGAAQRMIQGGTEGEIVDAVQKPTKSGMDLPANDWNNRMRESGMKVATKIPYIGQAASVILGLFWPVDKVNIFESIKQDIENLVDKKILAKELEERQNEIDGLRSDIEQYTAAMTHEKGPWLIRWIGEANQLKIKLRQTSNDVHFILLSITLALLHLTGLRERLQHGKEIYVEDNTPVWKKDLEDAYRDYVVVYFPDIYKKWKVWRADQVVINRWLSQHFISVPPFYCDNLNATVEDKVSGAKHEYYKDFCSLLSVFDDITNLHKTKMCNDAYTQMAGCITATFDFYTIVPFCHVPPYDKEVFGTMFLGPYAEDLLYGPGRLGEPSYRRTLDYDDYNVSKGSLTQLRIREWNTIDAMQFFYENGSGTLAGNSGGGQEHWVVLTGESYSDNKYVSGLRMGFSNGLLCYVQVLFTDGTKSDTFGNRGRWGTCDVVANGPPGYKLRSWSYGVNSGPSRSYGPGTLKLQYEVQEPDAYVT